MGCGVLGSHGLNHCMPPTHGCPLSVSLPNSVRLTLSRTLNAHTTHKRAYTHTSKRSAFTSFDTTSSGGSRWRRNCCIWRWRWWWWPCCCQCMQLCACVCVCVWVCQRLGVERKDRRDQGGKAATQLCLQSGHLNKSVSTAACLFTTGSCRFTSQCSLAVYCTPSAYLFTAGA